MTHALMRKAWPMGIRSLLRKVFGRSAEPVPENSDATSAAVPNQAERTPLDAAAAQAGQFGYNNDFLSLLPLGG
ncbi:hypothetical protein SIN09_19725, partial [Streptomyces sp. F8]|uniref:hypothetical protein n=1 Tax=Streptomyces sp. F8 TaxID=1436085 RepID=UPI0029CCE861